MGGEINSRDEHQRTPLMLAWDSAEKTQKLLQVADIDVNAKDENGWTALHWAATCNLQVLQVLGRDQRIDLNSQNNYGKTALMLAANGCKIESVRILLAAGCNVTIKNSEEKTALDIVDERIKSLREMSLDSSAEKMPPEMRERESQQIATYTEIRDLLNHS